MSRSLAAGRGFAAADTLWAVRRRPLCFAKRHPYLSPRDDRVLPLEEEREHNGTSRAILSQPNCPNCNSVSRRGKLGADP